MTEQTEATAGLGIEWFYTDGGQRKGPVSATALKSLLDAGTLDSETPIWRKGLAGWLPIRETELAAHDQDGPPPIATSHINNGMVWALAVAPIIYAFVEVIFIMGFDAPDALYWVIPVCGNATLCLLDERQLKGAGYDSNSLTFFALLLAPVYLFVRANRLRQQPIYGYVWIASFIVSIYLLS